MDWTDLSQDRNKQWAVLRMGMNLWVIPWCLNFLCQKIHMLGNHPKENTVTFGFIRMWFLNS
jgi:hypothetical protein